MLKSQASLGISVCQSHAATLRPDFLQTLGNSESSMRSFGSSLVVLAILCLVQWISGGHAFPKPVSKHPVRFEITLTWEDHEVAGITRKTILSNGQFPGPILQLQQGDDVVFVVKNQMPFSTTVHFHGMVCLSSLYVLWMGSNMV